MPKTRFGDTVPYYHIAKEYGLDYGDVLALADIGTHGRWPPESVARGISDRIVYVLRTSTDVLDTEMAAQINRFKEIREGAGY